MIILFMSGLQQMSWSFDDADAEAVHFGSLSSGKKRSSGPRRAFKIAAIGDQQKCSEETMDVRCMFAYATSLEEGSGVAERVGARSCFCKNS
jgi:hypothetical protein